MFSLYNYYDYRFYRYALFHIANDIDYTAHSLDLAARWKKERTKRQSQIKEKKSRELRGSSNVGSINLIQYVLYIELPTGVLNIPREKLLLSLGRYRLPCAKHHTR